MRLVRPVTLLTLALAALSAAEPRIVGCDEPVRSVRRGICANHLAAEDFTALAPGVSWFYNWYHRTGDVAPADLHFEFLPMMWGDDAERLAGLETYLTAGNKPRAVLAINEPNLRGQAFITPEVCAGLFIKAKAIADAHGIPIVGPHMAIGSPGKDSITAPDPVEHKTLTYTYMVPYLKAFRHFLGTTPGAGLGVHSYGDIHELRWAVESLAKEFGQPVWVTEFAHWSAKSDGAELEYLVQATDFLEHSPTVAGYAWFKERSDHQRISLFAAQPGVLTALGHAYVDMPACDPDVYYRVPGRLQVERYTTGEKIEVKPTDDADGFLQVRAQDKGACVDLQLAPEHAGTYRLGLRLAGRGQVVIQSSGRQLAELTVAGDGWQTVETSAALGPGPQTVRLILGNDQRCNWIEVAR